MAHEPSLASTAASIIVGSYKNDAFVSDDGDATATAPVAEAPPFRYVGTLCEIDLRSGSVVEAGKQLAGKTTGAGDAKRITYDDALDVIGFGRMQIVVLLVCGTIIMTVLTETMGMGLIMTAAHCDMELSATRKGVISSVTFAGILFSSQIWGFLADTRGRRRVIVATMLAANLCTVISSFSTDFTMFVVSRFAAGVFMSASSCVTYAYLGEFNTSKNRSTVIAVACIFAGAAYVYLPAMGVLILPGQWSIYISESLQFRPWRLLVIVNTLPGFLAALCLSRLPESGKFLLTRGREDDAITVLRRIHRMNTGCPADSFSVHALLPENGPLPASATDVEPPTEIGCLAQFWRQTVPLFQRPLRLHFLVCCCLVFGVFFVSAGIGMWYPEIQNRIARSNATDGGGGASGQTVCEVLEGAMHRRPADDGTGDGGADFLEEECNDIVSYATFSDYGILGGYYVLMYVIYALGIRRLGQGPFLVSFLFISGVAGLALQWIAQPMAVVVLFSSHIVFSGVCISLLTGIVVALIPTEYRGMAVSISMMFGRVGSIVGSNLVGVLLERDCSATFYLYSIFILACGLISLMLPFRTL